MGRTSRATSIGPQLATRNHRNVCPQFPAGTAKAACAPGAASWEAARLGVQLPGTAFATLGERIRQRGPGRGTVERCQGGPALWIEPRGKSAALEQHETAGRFTHKSQLQHGSIAERGEQMAQVKPA